MEGRVHSGLAKEIRQSGVVININRVARDRVKVPPATSAAPQQLGESQIRRGEAWLGVGAVWLFA
ncbi:hypothetical protein TIFTF001_031180 [Ficus carica]|uniref:Uncharacterized protein n=1 Tax=Ficus carica TaxID=3494 RepID=A0AA88DVV7_FICCA|nr:hypothetical protein TIFTF001_031180 [Ficus carica]